MKSLLQIAISLAFAAAAYSAEKAEPLSGKLAFENGKVGRSAVFPGTDKLRYSAEYLKANAGTVEMWVMPDPAASGNTQCLVSLGSNNPLWFMGGLDRTGVVFLYTKKKPEGKFEYYNNIRGAADFAKPGEWRHLSFVWAFTKPGECLMLIYVDGQLKEAKWDLNTGDRWVDADKAFAVGFSSASASAPVFNGRIDELRISNYPKSPSEIKTSYEKGCKGEPLSPEPGTLLLLNFDDSLAGLSSARDAETQEKIAKSAEKMMNELYPSN